MIFVALFIFYSFIGWIIDSTYRSLVDGKLVSHTYFNIPFAPIYGLGALLVLWLHPVFSLLPVGLAGLAHGLVLAAWEYVGGLLCVHVLKKQLWKYEGSWAIGEHTSVDRVFAWGASALVLIYVIHPLAEPVLLSLVQ